MHYLPASIDNLTQVVEYVMEDGNDTEMEGIVEKANEWCRSNRGKEWFALKATIEVPWNDMMDIQENIDNATEKEMEDKLKNMTELDPMDGTATNKRKHLLSHADPDDRPTFEEMDDLLKENGITYNTISEEIQLPTQEKENPKASNKTRRTQNTTNWNNLIIPPWNE